MFIFDVDGTLSPSRQVIDPQFKQWFLTFIKHNETHLATGSDYSKTLQQLGEDICHNVATLFNCSGNDIWKQGKNIFRNRWKLPNECEHYLLNVLANSKFPIRAGNHIEHRPGTINFSIVGRNASVAQRAEYIAWDNASNERHNICVKFTKLFPKLSALTGGETGVDIMPVNYDKGQIINYFPAATPFTFIGDQIRVGGNDYPLAVKNTLGTNIQVNNWQDTWKYLLTITS